MSKNKPIGNLTKKARAYIIHQFVSDIKQAGFAIKSILNVNQKHIQAAVDTWKAGELSPSTINSRLSTLRWLAKAIGKNGMILPSIEYGLSPEDTKRTYIARDDHSWTNKNVFPSEKIAQVREKDEWVAMHMELMNAFGLRVSRTGKPTAELGTKSPDSWAMPEPPSRLPTPPRALKAALAIVQFQRPRPLHD